MKVPKRIILYDLVILVLLLFPAVILGTLGRTCAFVNEGRGAGGCMFGDGGTQLVEISFMYFTVLSFGGFIVILPILIFAFVKTWKYHVQLSKQKKLSTLRLALTVPGITIVWFGAHVVFGILLIFYETGSYWISQI